MNPKEQGDNSLKMFRGESISSAAFSIYSESAPLFAGVITKYMQTIGGGEHFIADLGSHKGAFLQDLLSRFPQYKFHSIAIDVNGDDLSENPAEIKINSDLTNINLPDKSVDIVVCRYVLAWNDLESQNKIISEIKRVGRGIGIIQHQGAESENPGPLQNASKDLFSGVVSKLKRENFFFSTPDQIENLLLSQGVEFECIQDRKVPGLSELLIEKYELSGEDAENVKRILRDSDYVNQTTWILKF